jgi:endonuclease YncB( thermonuclease family)
MEERSTKFSLLVTGIFLLGLLILAAILKPSRSTESSPTSVSASKVSGSETVSVPPTQQMLPPPPRDGRLPVPPPSRGDMPSVPAEKARQQILTNCRLKPDASNDGDSFTVMTRSCDYRFSLYFVDAPDAPLDGKQISAQTAYFALSEEQLRLVARSGKDFITKILSDRTFDVVTRWERAPEEAPNREVTCRAFVYLTARTGEPTNLAALLVEQGLATVCTSQELLPDQSNAEMFLADLQLLEQKAIAQKRGAWHYAANPNTTPVTFTTH